MIDYNNNLCPGDYVVRNWGALGSSYFVSRVEDKPLGVFSTKEQVDKAIKEQMDKDQFWPSVWYESDHGNISLW